MADEMMMEEEQVMPEEQAPEAPMEEEAAPAGSVMTHTVEEMPELADYGVGDVIEMQIIDLTDDGTYSMTVVPKGPQTGGEEAVRTALG